MSTKNGSKVIAETPPDLLREAAQLDAPRAYRAHLAQQVTLEKCRVEFKQGQVIPGLGGGTRRFANGLFNPATLVAEVELQPGMVTLVSVHCAIITVDRRPRPESLPESLAEE